LNDPLERKLPLLHSLPVFIKDINKFRVTTAALRVVDDTVAVLQGSCQRNDFFDALRSPIDGIDDILLGNTIAMANVVAVVFFRIFIQFSVATAIFRHNGRASFRIHVVSDLPQCEGYAGIRPPKEQHVPV
jgi:hypothetical protein